jgi:hypothetical protein
MEPESLPETPPDADVTRIRSLVPASALAKSGCEMCGARVDELRRGRCWGCYQRWVESRPVGLGAACACCGERRHDFLRQVEILRAWVPMCHNCAARALKLSPVPPTLEGIRQRLQRDRRWGDRRNGQPDTREGRRERRGLERRAVGLVEGDDFLMLDDVIEILDADLVEVSGS